MSYLRWLILVLFLCCGLQAEQIKVLSWNMAWFPHGNNRNPLPASRLEQRISEAAKQLKSYNADVLVLQEIHDGECAEQIATAMGADYQMVICSKFRGFGDDAENGRQQQCIIIKLGKLSADCAWSEQWSSFGKFDPARGMVYAELLCRQQRVAVYGVHLKSNFMRKRSFVEQQKNMLKRELAITQLLNHRRLIELNQPDFAASIVAGDFNTNADSLEFSSEATLSLLAEQGFSSGYEKIPLKSRITYPGKHAGCIDYIFVQSRQTQQNTRLLDDTRNISDHLPIIRVVELP